jgi:hypothetical protein
VFTDRNSIAAALELVHGLDIRFTAKGATDAGPAATLVAAVIIAQALDRFTERIDLIIAEAKKPDSALR